MERAAPEPRPRAFGSQTSGVILALFIFSMVAVLVIWGLEAKKGKTSFWAALTDDPYEVSIAAATFSMIVAFRFTEGRLERPLGRLAHSDVLEIDTCLLSRERVLHKARLHSPFFLLLLLAFWLLAFGALRLAHVGVADFDWLGTLDFVLGRGVWISIFAWFFWWSIVGARSLTRVFGVARIQIPFSKGDSVGGIESLGMAILGLSSPLFVATVVGLVWLLPPFTEDNEGAKAVAFLPPLAAVLTVAVFFVPCVWRIHQKLKSFREERQHEISARLRASYEQLVRSGNTVSPEVAGQLQVMFTLRDEFEKLPLWPFSLKSGIFFGITQVAALATTVLKIGEEYGKHPGYLRKILELFSPHDF